VGLLFVYAFTIKIDDDWQLSEQRLAIGFIFSWIGEVDSPGGSSSGLF